MYDGEAGEIHLDPKDAKTRKGRSLAVVGPLRSVLERRLKARRLDTQLIFHRVSRGRPAQPVLRFSKMWRKALEAAKLPPGLLPYDLRRSAIRNLIRAGVSQTVAMKISGHRTDSTFRRYDIASMDDVAQALETVGNYVAALPTDRTVTKIKRAQFGHSSTHRRKTR